MHYRQTLSLFSHTGKSLKLIHKHSSFSDLFLALNRIVLEKAFKYQKLRLETEKSLKAGFKTKTHSVVYVYDIQLETLERALTIL